MFGSVGLPEVILILIIALLVFGPKKLPEVGRSLGKAMREFKKASDEITGQIEREIQVSEFKDAHKGIRAGVDSLKDSLRGIFDASGTTGVKKEKNGISDAPAPAAPAKETRADAALDPAGGASPKDDTRDDRPEMIDLDGGEGQKIN